ncbi:TetR/AcrR family transcriptional regulator [Streptomyces justiciae]|uniref:TetR/AcrR family transcriptional regulator n=1 Tax=Streptomyces justiciae TaxID=2780140 RepID=UPI0021189654|nr:TetR/AcrR family transcriptional regulator [Streptomyces justiciae]MCW8378642.1 TetR/AcrR family transcriptional regulator [Streptomyces justiciae]
MPEAATSSHRRLTPKREAELYEAVLSLLREVGYDALTMDAVATRTRCSKATLYRQWGGKAKLVVRAVQCVGKGTSLMGTDIDTGSLKGDLHALVLRSDDSEAERLYPLMRGLTMAIHGNPELLRVFQEYLIEPERAAFGRVLRRAVDRGEIRAANPAIGYVLHMMIGAYTARAMVEDQPPKQAFFLSYIDSVVLPVLVS